MGEDTAVTERDPLGLPDFVRTILESVAKWMRADQGHWKLELQFQDGHLRRWFKHEEWVGATDL